MEGQLSRVGRLEVDKHVATFDRVDGTESTRFVVVKMNIVASLSSDSRQLVLGIDGDAHLLAGYQLLE